MHVRGMQKALESGEAAHLFPVDPKKVKAGAIKLEDVPYMQRRDGRWDQSDVRATHREARLLPCGRAPPGQLASCADRRCVGVLRARARSARAQVKGAAKRKWSRWDKAYENGGRAQSTSVSIFGGASLPWCAPLRHVPGT